MQLNKCLTQFSSFKLDTLILRNDNALFTYLNYFPHLIEVKKKKDKQPINFSKSFQCNVYLIYLTWMRVERNTRDLPRIFLHHEDFFFAFHDDTKEMKTRIINHDFSIRKCSANNFRCRPRYLPTYDLSKTTQNCTIFIHK